MWLFLRLRCSFQCPHHPRFPPSSSSSSVLIVGSNNSHQRSEHSHTLHKIQTLFSTYIQAHVIFNCTKISWSIHALQLRQHIYSCCFWKYQTFSRRTFSALTRLLWLIRNRWTTAALMQLLIIEMRGADFYPESDAAQHLSYYVMKMVMHDNNVSLVKYQRDSVTFNLREVTTHHWIYISSFDFGQPLRLNITKKT